MHFKSILAIVAASLAVANAHAQQGGIYEEPGIDKNRAGISVHPNEYIDPFTGRLQLHNVDILIPGDGGLDLKIQRSYNNLQVVPSGTPPTAGIVGIGWDMHFGRLRLGTGTTCTPATWGANVGLNPTLTLPDGSSHIVYRTTASYPGAMTKDWWKAECAAGGMWVTSPDGTRYELTEADTTANSFLTKAIQDRNGNRLDFTYAILSDGTKAVTTITRLGITWATFTYELNGTRRRLASITALGRTYSYDYTALGGSFGDSYYQLTSVNGPGPTGVHWGYSYYGARSGVGGSYSLQTVTLPYSGTVTYDYEWVTFTPSAAPVTAVKSKVASNPASPSATWTFAYSPSTSLGTLDTTIMTGTEGSTRWSHFGFATIVNTGEVWKLGLLAEKAVGYPVLSVHREEYTWDKRQISTQVDMRVAPYSAKTDNGAFSPVLTSRKITRDGSIYTTNYTINAGELYGNATAVAEIGNVTRTTNQTFFVSTAKWIVKQLKDQTTFVGGDNGAITRIFDTDGNMTNETRFGVSTNYTYLANGNVNSVTNARGKTTTFSSYVHGVPTFESRPETVSISRVVDDFGNVTSETDGESFTRAFVYDGLDRVTLVDNPIGNNASIAWNFPGRSKTATRGPFTETTTFDGFGRPVQVTHPAATPSNTQTMTYDGLGRKTFESYPGTGLGTAFEYDILGRIKKVTHGDGKTRTTSYLASNQESTTDERGETTVRVFRSFGDPDSKELMSIVSPEPGTNLTLTRNAFGQVLTATQGGVTRTYGYDSHRFLTSVVEPETGTTALTRDEVGNLKTRQVINTATSATTMWTYDDLDRVSFIAYGAGAPQVTKNYDRRSLLTKVTSTSAIRDLSYDQNGNLTLDKVTVGGTPRSLTMTYDGNDNLATVAYPTGLLVTYAPNSMGRPTVATPFVTASTYFASGNLASMTLGNGTSTTFTEQANRQWTNGITASGKVALGYTFDEKGNAKTIADSANTANNRTLDYDDIERLTLANGPWGSGTSIGYSANGDITSQVLGAQTVSYTYNNTSRLLTSATVAGSGRVFSYDVYRNVIGNGLHTFHYNDAQALDCVDCALPGKIEYFYDGLGHMVRSLANGIETVYVYSIDGRLMGEYVPGTADFRREHIYFAGKRVATRKNVTPATSTTTLAPVSTPSVYGQPLTLTATVTGLSPTGSVAFLDGGVPIAGCESKPLASGSAVCVVSGLGVGMHTLTAAYGGDELNLPSSSAPQTVTVTQAQTTTTITAPNPATVGQVTTITVAVAAVAPGSGAPTGTVTVNSNAAFLCTITLPANSCTTNYATPGPRTLTASYSGDMQFAASNSAPFEERVLTGGLFRDFGADGRSDVLWRRNDGLVYQWFMNGPAISGTGTPASLSLDWIVEGIGDVSGDGKADLVWRNTTTGEMYIWAMDGGTVVDSHGYGIPDLGWKIVAVADVNGDGHNDLVWRHSTTGDISVWTMADIHTPTAYGLGSVDPSWKIAAVGDMDRNGRADFLWRHPSGAMIVWYGGSFPAFTVTDFGLVDAAWTVAGLGDYNLDGSMDIVWRHATGGDVYIWMMGPGGFLSGAGFGAVPLDWVIKGVGDYDGDGRSDLMWRQTSTGSVYLWHFTSPSTMVGQDIGVVGPEWTMVNP